MDLVKLIPFHSGFAIILKLPPNFPVDSSPFHSLSLLVARGEEEGKEDGEGNY